MSVASHFSKCKFYGSATVGPKGQIVIPAEARTEMGIKPGDKVLIISNGHQMVGVCPASQFEKFLNHLSDHLNMLRDAVGGKTTKPTKK